MPDSTELSETQIDRFPVADLPARYDLKSAALYKRFEALGIKPLRLGRASYVSGEQLAEMDKLHCPHEIRNQCKHKF